MSEQGEMSPMSAAAIETAQEAWNHFTTRMMPYLLTRNPDEHASCAPEDELLAAFLRAHPGEFESSLPDYAAHLASAVFADPHVVSWLSLLLEVNQGDPRFYKTFAALDPAVGLRVCSMAGFRYFDALSARARDNIGCLAQMFMQRLTPDARRTADLPPELRDSYTHRSRLPNILPDDLDGMSPTDIETVIEAYVRAPIRAFEARLRPKGCSLSGFLAPGELLGEVIWEDARKLRELGVSRHTLAGGLQQAVELFQLKRDGTDLERAKGFEQAREGGSPEQIELFATCARQFRQSHQEKLDRIEGLSPSTYAVQAQLDVSLREFMGTQDDPFHTLPWHSTNHDFKIQNPALGPHPVLEGSQMTITLIRRLGFFEGRVPHRIDPETAARVLGLVA